MDTHEAGLRFSSVIDQPIVIADLPIVTTSEFYNVLTILRMFFHFDYTGFVCQVVMRKVHQESVQDLNLVELESYVVWEIDWTNTIAVDAEREVLLQPFEGFRLPCYVNVKPVVAFLCVFYLNIGITLLIGYLVANVFIFLVVIAELLRPFKQVKNDAGI